MKTKPGVMNVSDKIEIEIYDDDTALAGDEAPPRATQIDGLIKYLATISHRFGNTAVTYSIQWGASALWRSDALTEKIVELGAREQALADVLTELCTLKQHKFDLGKTKHYLKRQPIAWENARQLINPTQEKAGETNYESDTTTP